MKFSEITQAQPAGAKQAALLVHAMAPADQEWIWTQLPSAQQAELKSLIAELEALGVDKDRQALSLELAKSVVPSTKDGAAPDGQQGSAGIATASSLSDVEFLCALSSEEVHELAKIWSAEPPRFVAVALNAHDWPWRVSLLELMPAAHARRVDDLLLKSAHKPSPLLVQAMLQDTRASLAQAQRETGVFDSLLDRDPHGSSHWDARSRHHRSLGSEGRGFGRAAPHWAIQVAESIRAPWRRLLSSRSKELS